VAEPDAFCSKSTSSGGCVGLIVYFETGKKYERESGSIEKDVKTNDESPWANVCVCVL
jgi:hypothetical protein